MNWCTAASSVSRAERPTLAQATSNNRSWPKTEEGVLRAEEIKARYTD